MADENMGIRIVIVSSLVTRERFIEALEEGFVNTTAGKSSPSDVDKFKKFLSDPFIEGDEIVLNYHKGEAVHLYNWTLTFSKSQPELNLSLDYMD